jgi:prepilin-type N-terminal cleavage/methylation domain-containing protein
MKTPRSVRGFSLVEMLVVLALAAILMFFSVPALLTTMRQARLRGVAQESTVLMRQARLDAIKTSSQAVVRIVPSTPADPIPRVEAFSDRNLNGKLDAGEPVLGRVEVPARVFFKDQAGNTDKASVENFIANPENSSMPNVAMFQSDGTIKKDPLKSDLDGAYHFADDSDNYLRVRVEYNTARIEVQKWQNGKWIANGENGEAWSWN